MQTEPDSSNYPDWIAPLIEEGIIEWIQQPLHNQMGSGGFALIAGTVLVLGLWGWSDSLFPPAIVLALFGGTIITVVPGPAATIGVGLVAVGLALALLSIWGDR